MSEASSHATARGGRRSRAARGTCRRRRVCGNRGGRRRCRATRRGCWGRDRRCPVGVVEKGDAGEAHEIVDVVEDAHRAERRARAEATVGVGGVGGVGGIVGRAGEEREPLVPGGVEGHVGEEAVEARDVRLGGCQSTEDVVASLVEDAEGLVEAQLGVERVLADPRGGCQIARRVRVVGGNRSAGRARGDPNAAREGTGGAARRRDARAADTTRADAPRARATSSRETPSVARSGGAETDIFARARIFLCAKRRAETTRDESPVSPRHSDARQHHPWRTRARGRLLGGPRGSVETIEPVARVPRAPIAPRSSAPDATRDAAPREDRLPKRDWAAMTTADFEAMDAASCIAILPAGAVEQHGPHLPVCVDAAINAGVLSRAMELLPDEVPVVRMLPCPTAIRRARRCRHRFAERRDAPGGVDGHRRVRASRGGEKLILFNSHGGQPQIMDVVARDLRKRLGMLVVTQLVLLRSPGRPLRGERDQTRDSRRRRGDERDAPPAPGAGGHVARGELRQRGRTHGERVSTSHAGGRGRLGWLAQDLNPSGAIGNAAMATTEKGELCVEHAAERLVALIEEVDNSTSTASSTATREVLSGESPESVEGRGRVRRAGAQQVQESLHGNMRGERAGGRGARDTSVVVEEPPARGPNQSSPVGTPKTARARQQ